MSLIVIIIGPVRSRLDLRTLVELRRKIESRSQRVVQQMPLTGGSRDEYHGCERSHEDLPKRRAVTPSGGEERGGSMPTRAMLELQQIAARVRLDAIQMVLIQGFGYLGQALSSAEIFTALFAGG